MTYRRFLSAAPVAVILAVIATVAAGTAAPADNLDIVVRAADISQAALHGAWTLVGDPLSEGGMKLAVWRDARPDDGRDGPDPLDAHSRPLGSPSDYFDIAFNARAGVPYRVWVHMKSADGRTGSVWLQFSDAAVSGARAYAIGTPTGLLVTARACAGCNGAEWSWRDTSWSIAQPSTVTFTTDDVHVLRVQAANGAAELDRILLSVGPAMPAGTQETPAIASRH